MLSSTAQCWALRSPALFFDGNALVVIQQVRQHPTSMFSVKSLDLSNYGQRGKTWGRRLHDCLLNEEEATSNEQWGWVNIKRITSTTNWADNTSSQEHIQLRSYEKDTYSSGKRWLGLGCLDKKNALIEFVPSDKTRIRQVIEKQCRCIAVLTIFWLPSSPSSIRHKEPKYPIYDTTTTTTRPTLH